MVMGATLRAWQQRWPSDIDNQTSLPIPRKMLPSLCDYGGSGQNADLWVVRNMRLPVINMDSTECCSNAEVAQVVKESMRMFPVSASGLGRYTKEPTVLGGYLIPAGCEIQVTMHKSASTMSTERNTRHEL